MSLQDSENDIQFGLAVVVGGVEVDGEYQFERVRTDQPRAYPEIPCGVAGQAQVEEVVMESTAQYWKPV